MMRGLFTFQYAPDIKKRLMNSEDADGLIIRQVHAIATNVYNNRGVQSRAEEKKKQAVKKGDTSPNLPPS